MKLFLGKIDKYTSISTFSRDFCKIWVLVWVNMWTWWKL